MDDDVEKKTSHVFYGRKWIYWNGDDEDNTKKNNNSEMYNLHQGEPSIIWHLITDSKKEIDGEMYIRTDDNTNGDTNDEKCKSKLVRVGQKWNASDDSAVYIGSGLFNLTERRNISYLLSMRQADAARHLRMTQGKLSRIWTSLIKKKRQWPSDRLNAIYKEKCLLKLNRSTMNRRKTQTQTDNTSQNDHNNSSLQNQHISAGVVNHDEDLIQLIDSRLSELEQEIDNLLSPCWVPL